MSIDKGTCPANADTQTFLETCTAVTEIRQVGDTFEFDYDTEIEVSHVPESLGIEW